MYPGSVTVGQSDLSGLIGAYACSCDESVMYDSVLYPEQAAGMWVWMENDSEPYLDLVLGYSSNSFGHVHEEISRAAQDACGRLTQIHSFHTRAKLELSELLSQGVSPHRPYNVYFDVGGASVVGGALRLCRSHTGNRKIVCFSGAFHGTSYLAATVTDDALLDKSQYGLGSLDEDIVRLPYPDQHGLVSTDSCVELLEAAFNDGDVAGVIVEPIQGAAGFRIPRADFLPRLRELTRNADVPLILDEIQTGVGRTGALYSFSRYGIEPDIVLLSKSLAGGYFPLSSLIADPAYFESVPAWRTAFQSTFNNSPFGVAVALETLRIAARECIFENAAKQGPKLLQELNFLSSCPSIVNLRGDGLAIAFDLVGSRGESSRELAQLFTRSALQQHVIVYACGIAGNVVKIAPMLGINDDDRAIITDALKRSLSTFLKELS